MDHCQRSLRTDIGLCRREEACRHLRAMLGAGRQAGGGIVGSAQAEVRFLPAATELRPQPRQPISVTWEAYKPQCQPPTPPSMGS